MAQTGKTKNTNEIPTTEVSEETVTKAPGSTPKKATARKTAKKKATKKVAKKKTGAKRAGIKKAGTKKSSARKSAPVPGTTMTEALGETFLVDLITDWQEHGGGVIEACRTTKPDAYLKLVATYAPKEFRKTLEPFEGMNDNDLKARLNETLEEIRTLGLDLGA